MTDSNLIWKYLTREYMNTHPVIHQYVTGTFRKSEVVLGKVLSDVRIIFCPAISENYVKSIIRQFLDNKKLQYHEGKLSVKSIY